jgi:hypothetical protein
MNAEQMKAIIGTLVALALGPSSYFITNGILTADQAAQLQPAIVTIATTIGGAILVWWANHRHTSTALVTAVNSSAVPGVFVAASTPANANVPQVTVTHTGAVVPDPAQPLRGTGAG